MELLSLDLIGWLFSVTSGIALVLGMLIMGMNYSHEATRSAARKRIVEDVSLIVIWTLGLAGGVGVLLGKDWSRSALEFFCWTLMVLLLMSCWSWLRAAPRPRNMRAIQLALLVLPVLAICVATIYTLRSETAQRVLSG